VEKGDYTTFWSLGEAYGSFSITADRAELKLCEGRLGLRSFRLPTDRTVKSLLLDGVETRFDGGDGVLTFEETIIAERLEVIFK